MIGGAGSRHRRRRSSPGVHFAQAQQVARLAALNNRVNDADGLEAPDGPSELSQALARRRSSKLLHFTPLQQPIGELCFALLSRCLRAWRGGSGGGGMQMMNDPDVVSLSNLRTTGCSGVLAKWS